MEKMDYQPGLIRYTTENALEGKKTRIMRPRMLVYATLLSVIFIGTVWSMTTRIPLRADLIRDRNQLYRELSEGRIENVYTLKLINMDDKDHRYLISLPGNDDVSWNVNPQPVLKAGEIGRFSFTLQAPAKHGSGSVEVEVHFEAEDNQGINFSRTTRMLLPVNSLGNR